MRKLILNINMTLNGGINHEDVIADEEHHYQINKFLDEIDTVIFGRKSFQLLEGYWPKIAHTKQGSIEAVKFAEQMEDMSKIVFSKSLQTVSWQNTAVNSGDLKTEIINIKDQHGKDIALLASPSLAATLTELRLIDEYHIFLQPIVSGQPQLFPNFSRLNLNLFSTKTLQSGVIILKYQR